MPAQGPFLSGAVKQTNLGQPSRLRWDNPAAVQVVDAIAATSDASPQTYRNTFKIHCTNFGFTIPAGSAPVGITMTVHCTTSGIGVFGRCQDGYADLMDGEVVIGQIAPVAGDWTINSLGTRTLGGSANLWGWTPAAIAIINSTDFGVRFEAQVPEDQQAAIDWIKVEVTYAAFTYAAVVGSGGLGAGGAESLRKEKRIAAGGVGAGAIVGRKYKPTTSGGVGVSGEGLFHRKRSIQGSGGVAAGNGPSNLRVFLNGIGGIGGGGTSGYRQEIHVTGSGGAGAGGELSLLKAILQGVGGAGAGGSGVVNKRRTDEGTGGIGAGYQEGAVSKQRHVVGEGGVGVGSHSSIVSQRVGILGSGGIGAGGNGTVSRSTSTSPDGDPEDAIIRTHRGPATRRMVFEAVRRALVDGPLDRYKVYLSDDEPDMNEIPPGDSFAVIIPGHAANDQGDTAGGGIIGTMRVDSARVRVYSSNNTDQYARTTSWNLRVDKGAMERARKIRRTLNMNDLADDAGWLLLTEAMRATTTSGRLQRANPKWGFYEETFEITYTEYLTGIEDA